MAEYTIQVTTGPSAGVETTLSGGTVTIGRSPSSDLPVNDPKVSRAHARLTDSGREVTLTDLQSSNGTVVNGRSVTSIVLSPGDTIVVGDSEIAFRETGRGSGYGPPADRGAASGSSSSMPWMLIGIGAVVLVAVIGAAFWFFTQDSAPAIPCQVDMTIGSGGLCQDIGFTIEVGDTGDTIIKGNVEGVPYDTSFPTDIEIGNLRVTRHDGVDGPVWRIDSLPSNPVIEEEPTPTPEPTATPEPTPTPEPTATPAPTATPLPNVYDTCTVGLVLQPGDSCEGEGYAIRIDRDTKKPVGPVSIKYSSEDGNAWTITNLGQYGEPTATPEPEPTATPEPISTAPNCTIGLVLQPGEECAGAGYTVQVNAEGHVVLDGAFGDLTLSTTFTNPPVEIGGFKAKKSDDGNSWTIEELPQ